MLLRPCRPRLYPLVLAATVLLTLPECAFAGTFVADFTKPALDPLLSKSNSLRSAATVTSGGGVLAFAYDAGSKYDYGAQKVITTFNVVGDFVARVTATISGDVQAGLEMFSGADPGAPNPKGASTTFPNDATAAFSRQGTAYTKPGGSGYNTAQRLTTVDLKFTRTGNSIEQSFDIHDGKGFYTMQPAFQNAMLSGSVKLALYIANASGAVSARFSDFEISSASVASSGPRPVAVPEPATITVFGAGLLGLLGALARRPVRRRS